MKNQWSHRCVAFLSGLVVAWSVCAPHAMAQDTVTEDTVRLVKKLSLGRLGSQVLRFGDLNGDGKGDLLSIQSRKRKITALIAVTLEGEVLWTRGRVNERNFSTSSDLPVQLFDTDRDGKDEVVLVRGGKLQILDGTTGQVRRSVKAPGKRTSSPADDAIYINWFGPGGELRILVKNRYRNFWIYDGSLRRQWSRRGKTGHYPLALDIQDDGRPEILVGYSLYGAGGRRLWSVRGRVKRHADGLDAGDMNGDGRLEIAVAASGESVLVGENGKILWRKPHKHSQHAILGNFLPDNKGEMQAVFVDRGQDGTLFSYDYAGNQLWQSGPHGRVSIISTVDGWTGREGESLVFVFRRAYGPPILLNGAGEEVAQFPFPPAKVGETYGQHFAQHFDLFGDAREEILVHDHRELWIYENPVEMEVSATVANEKLPNPRIWNATFYTGTH
ncbi:VCBS repeat-containing protein [bacterium]|nr:VCBS repeat-containing protein [bacterium]